MTFLEHSQPPERHGVCPECGTIGTLSNQSVVYGDWFCSLTCKMTMETNRIWRQAQGLPATVSEKVGIPERFFTPWNDSVAPYMPKMRAAAERFSETFRNPATRGIFLAGNTGIGKSRIASEIAKRVHEKGFTVRWQGSAMLFARLRDTIGAEHRESEMDVLADLLAPDLLVLDDLGVERPSDWVLDHLYMILNERIEKQKKVVATSNFDLSGLQRHWSKTESCAYVAERLISRLRGACNEVAHFGTQDLRAVYAPEQIA